MKVSGPKVLADAMTALLTDPRVGYSVGDVGYHCEVKLEGISGGPPHVDGNGRLSHEIVPCVVELTTQRVLVGNGNDVSVTVGVPVGMDEPVLRGVLRGIMRYGGHGKAAAVVVPVSTDQKSWLQRVLNPGGDIH